MTDSITRAELLAAITDAGDALAEPADLIWRLQDLENRLRLGAAFEGGPFAIETDACLRIVDSKGRTVG